MEDFEESFLPNTSDSWATRNSKCIIIAAVIVIVAVLVACISIGVVMAHRKTPGERLSVAVQVPNIMRILSDFEGIADRPSNRGSRAVQQGFNDTLNYMISNLQSMGICDVSTETFGVPFFTVDEASMSWISSADANDLQDRTDFRIMNFGGNGTYDITGPVVVAKNFGCHAEDYENVTGKIVMVFYNPNDRVDCTAYEKALNASHVSARAILIANDATRHSLSASRLRGTGYWPGAYEFVQVPVLAVSYSTAHAIQNLPSLKLNIQTTTSISIVETQNLFCTTKEGDANQLMVFGAHLDSVPAGPGINDNGSGAGTLLEVVKQMNLLKMKPKNKIQFSWWGAEEPGQFGSRWFVHNTRTNKPELWKTIKAALNFDTIASPNGIPQVYSIREINGGNETFPESAHIGSDAITATFLSKFKQMKHPYLLIAFEGGSDYYSFVQNGIPTGGLDSGAADVLTVDQAKIFGGLPNFVNDPCYHEACDRVSNIGQGMLSIMSRAAAYTIGTLAMEEDLVGYLAKGLSAASF